MTTFYQCRLSRGIRETTGWIESRGAKVGLRVQLTSEGEELWDVIKVSGPPLQEWQLKEYQRMNRGSLPSVKPPARPER